MNSNHDRKTITSTSGSLASVLMATLVLALIALAPAAARADRANYHGSVCVPYFGDGEPHRNYTYGIYNPSGTRNLWVTCPVDRDQVEDTNMFLKVQVSQSASTSSRFSCTLYSKDYRGYTVDTSSAVLGYSETGYQFIYIAPVHNTQKYYGNYALLCSIPPYSSIRNIFAFEYE